MRFDDSLDTVLAADIDTPLGAEVAWRQLVDLAGRRRVPVAAALPRLDMLRGKVSAQIRASSARTLEHATPPAELVRFFAADEADIAAPVLRGARLSDDEWVALLPALTPRTRAVLRHRRDLSDTVTRALDGFGRADFVLGGDAAQAAAPAPPPNAPLAPDSFVSLGEAARRSLSAAEPEAAPATKPSGPFQIADLVARIAAYQQKREHEPVASPSSSVRHGFHFETDAAGVVRWVEGVNRGPLIGLSLDLASSQTGSGSRVDGVAAGAFRRRAAFASARLIVESDSDAGGDWRIDGFPMFDPDSGRFIGYRGTARRPRSDEQAAPVERTGMPPDALRQLVHELRTPTNAIAGFAEMIETQLLGPVASPYRARAATIRDQARELLAAIDDLDLAARIESKALDLRVGRVALAPLLDRVAADLAPLAELRGTRVALDRDAPTLEIAGDERAIERLIGRLLAALVAAGGRDEAIGVTASRDRSEIVCVFDRPAALVVRGDDGLLAIDDGEAHGDGAPLLGTGFALRLVRNLAGELGGNLTIDERRLTLRLPAAETATMEQVSIN
ncbi:sensor histidine kinase [Hephaestia mangrovi]|uniref:sensor histidine kinase n=1 Tax=Hephaestia mangrovi TaxID=2873268 RepID=UPI001CA63216|nr:HAMP domain-containing sensor histidine kinase [Hephaestia mangrovi]MBY8828247.1 HAMP domain-containing histidine kinase [Hephaestia mangrovi]